MTSQLDRLRSFKYSTEDRRALADILWPNMAALGGNGDHSYALDVLESASRTFLVSSYRNHIANRSEKRPDMIKRRKAAMSEFAKLAERLLEIEKEHHLISALAMHQPGYWRYPSENENFGQGDGIEGLLTPGEAVKETVEFALSALPSAIEKVETESDWAWWDSGNSPMSIFAGIVISEWSRWTCKVPGKSNSGGPSADFLAHCMSINATFWTDITGDTNHVRSLESDAAGYHVRKAMNRY